MPNELRGEKLCKRYGDVLAVDSVDVTLLPGITALVGANGAGKTTLLRMLAGALEPSGGTVTPLSPSQLAYVDQDPALDPEMTGDEILRLFAALYRVPPAAPGFGLDGILSRPVATYSGGQKRRLHLAAALLHSPQAIFLDEPTAGLDGEGTRLLWAELDRRAQAGAIIVVVGHDLDEVEREAAQVLVLERGQIIARGTPAELVAAHARTWLKVTLKERVELPLLPPGFSQPSLEGRRLWLVADDTARLDDLVAALPVADIAVHRRDLASAYRSLTGNELPAQPLSRRRK
jgi:ABC-type multidrug transport system ATPase subunit